jgi:hypothetical protein
MLMFEKISALESELATKEMALGDVTSKFDVTNKTVKTLSDRIREVMIFSLKLCPIESDR